MRIVTGMTYTYQHPHIHLDPVSGHSYFPSYYPSLLEQCLSRSAALMALVGHYEWHLVTVTYRQMASNKVVYPTYFITKVQGSTIEVLPSIRPYTEEYNQFDHRFHPPVAWSKIDDSVKKVLAAVRRRLKKLDYLSEFVLVSCFAFPTGSFLVLHPEDYVYRTLCDLKLHFEKSGEPDLKNAAQLADLV